MPTIDLNADIGEGFPNDLALLEVISSANICMGFHAGSPKYTEEVIRLARARGVRVGAHVGFPDRQSMGRRELEEGYPEEWIMSVEAQIRASGPAAYIKPHGALFHWLANAPEDSQYLWNVLEEMERPFMGLPGTGHETQCRRRGLRLINEGYCERGYDRFGRLLPRSEPGAVIHDLDAICDQAVRLASKVESICVHGDRPDAVKVAEAVRKTLEQEGYKITA
ncbi:MAG: LamB/YcsF family protein [Armatimonadetes bacterium]|nr:LamB/YcsF family protein [Armatimonadota bacterium]